MAFGFGSFLAPGPMEVRNLSEKERHCGLYSEKFKIMLKMIAHPDGGPWTGTKMSRATDGRVTSSYFGSLRDGHVDIPRADKIEAIAQAIGFPTQLWFKDIRWWRDLYSRWLHGDEAGLQLVYKEVQAEGGSHGAERLSELVNRLFAVRVNPDTGTTFTNEEVAERSGGVLTVRQIQDLRSGSEKDPTWGQILSLCEVFEVPPTYFSGAEVSWLPSPAMLDAADDHHSYTTFTNSRRLSNQNRSLLQSISEHLRRQQGDTAGGGAAED